MFSVFQLEREARLLHPPRSPNTSHSNNSTLETKHGKGGIKKIITEKIITTTTLERNKKDKKEGQPTTLERENEKNIKLANRARHSEVPPAPISNQPEQTKIRHSTGNDVYVMQTENGGAQIEQYEVQKRENDPKRGMKFGIRVLPPNVPDDGVLRQKSVENGSVTVEKKAVDEIDKGQQPQAPTAQVKHENETENKKPVVAKRREKMAPPIPNARVKHNETNSSNDSSKLSETSLTTFARSDLNSSGIKRDENGIPQELPQHMLEAAKAARVNRKSSEFIIDKDKIEKADHKKEEVSKQSKKSKGKAPSPPAREKNKTDDSMLEQLKNVNDFLKNEKQHSSVLHDSGVSTPTKSATSPMSTFNTSTPKVQKMKPGQYLDGSISFSQDDIDDIVSKPFRKESDSLNNYFEDSKSNMSSNQDVHSVVSFNNSEKSEKGSTTIELNNSDITIHSSPLNDTVHSASDDTSTLDENERKAASLGDLSRFELKAKNNKPSTGTLERAQSLDISADDDGGNTLSPKKRKAMSVVKSPFFDSGTQETLPDMVESEKGVAIKHKDPRLSLNIANTSAIEGLNTFQRNRLKKGSEFGNLEDAIVKGSDSSLNSEKIDTLESPTKKPEKDLRKEEPHESSDHLARRIMDENMKVHLKLVSEFAKSTSDGSNMSSLDSTQEVMPATSIETTPIKYEEKLSLSYDTNIPDDLKVSRNTHLNSLERPKSEMMKKLLAKNPILNVHIDQNVQKDDATTSKETPTPMTDSFKSAMHQPDIVNFDLKTSELKPRDYDEYVSNIRVGSNNNSLKHDKPQSFSTKWKERKENHGNNIVTISTSEKSPPEVEKKSYTKSIEIGEPKMRLIPDVIEGIQRRSDKREGTTLYMEPGNVSLTMTQEPVNKKTVTVNVIEDEYGNKVITQNVEKISTKYVTANAEPPLQVEQITFGIMKQPSDIDEMKLEEGNDKDIDRKVLEDIKKQNPNLRFTSEEPSFTRTETIILNTELDEDQATALMEKLKNDPTFMAQKTPEELSQMGVKIIHDLEDLQNKRHDIVEVTKTRYTINPSVGLTDKIVTQSPKDSEAHKDHVTEIQVVTPRTEKMTKQKSDGKISPRQRAPPYEEPHLTYELDIELLNDFISNERHHTAKQIIEANKRKSSQTSTEPKKRHSDFDLPRNSHIKFRTATYEPPKGTIVTSTDLENRRLSQMDQIQLRSGNDQLISSLKPEISAKPSSIPIKAEKTKTNQPVLSPGVSSKIPIFSQKSLSQENLMEKQFSLPRSPPPQLSSSTSNITVTSIKSSSRSPSGGML